VLMFSSSLPDRDGDLESSKGEENGPISELRLDLLDERIERGIVLDGESARSLRSLPVGGNRSSEESVGAAYIAPADLWFRRAGLAGGISDRDTP
jgi:hypothetical protein